MPETSPITNGHSNGAPTEVKKPSSASTVPDPDNDQVLGAHLVPGKPLTPQALASYYDKNALEAGKEYDANDWADEEQMYSQFDYFTSRVDLNGKSLLDVGTGNGLFIEYLQKKGIKPSKIIAIDISEEQIKVVKQRFPEVEAIAHDFLTYEFEESYDCVTMFGVAPCLKFIFPDKDRISALLRLLERGLRYTNYAMSVSFLNRNCYEMCEEENYEYLYFYPDEFCTLLSGARFEVSTVDNDLVSNTLIYAHDSWGLPFRFNLNRIDEVFKLFK